MAKTLFFTRGSTIIREGDSLPTVLYQIVKGRVGITRSKGTDSVEIDVYGPESFIAEYALIDKERASITVEALDDTEILAFEVDKDWDPPWAQCPGLVQDVAKDLVGKLRKSYEKLKRLQYFERITYDHLKGGALKSYHLKDILRMTRILSLVTFRFANTDNEKGEELLERDIFEDNIFQILSRTSVRLQDFIDVMSKERYLRLSENGRQLQEINLEQIEGFSAFLSRALRKNETSIYLKPMDVRALKMLLSVRHAQISGSNRALSFTPIGDQDQREIGMEFTEPEAIEYLVNEMGDEITARAALAQLINKKVILRKNPTMPRDQQLVLHYSGSAEIAKYQDTVIAFTKLV